MIIVLYVTHKNLKNAKKVSNYLIKKRLVACANIFPIRSLYMWKEKLSDDTEYVSLLKTSVNKASKAEKEIKKIHPYKIPCIIKIKVNPNKEYENWVNTINNQ